MTLDELIKELNEIKKKKGGNVEVYYVDREQIDGHASISEVEYFEGNIVSYVGVVIS